MNTIASFSSVHLEESQPEAHVCTVVGIGLRAQAQPGALQALWQQAQGLLPRTMPLNATGPAICAIAVLDSKAQHPALMAWLATLSHAFDTSDTSGASTRAQLMPVSADHMAGQPVATQSARLQARYGTGSVAEAAALCAAGSHATLAVPRLVAADGSATLAVAIRRAGHPGVCLAAEGRRLAAAPFKGTTA